MELLQLGPIIIGWCVILCACIAVGRFAHAVFFPRPLNAHEKALGVRIVTAEDTRRMQCRTLARKCVLPALLFILCVYTLMR